MGSLIYRPGDLFTAVAEKDAVLVHAASTQGVWGAGVARIFADRYPQAFQLYSHQCDHISPDRLLGTYGTWGTGDGPLIAWLFTAEHLGHQSRPHIVAEDTESAVKSMFRDSMMMAGDQEPKWAFHSPKMNSGLFGVPWELTEAVLKKTIEDTPYTWTVWTL